MKLQNTDSVRLLESHPSFSYSSLFHDKTNPLRNSNQIKIEENCFEEEVFPVVHFLKLLLLKAKLILYLIRINYMVVPISEARVNFT